MIQKSGELPVIRGELAGLKPRRTHIDNQPRQSYINLNIWIIVRQSSHETIIPHGLSSWIIVHYFLIYVLSPINRPHIDNQPRQSYINL